MKKNITHSADTLIILLRGKRFILKSSKEKLNRNYLVVQLLLTVVLLISIGCKKSDDNPPPVSANTVTDIDGNVYNTITIGTQVWMKENLKTVHYKNGDAIPTGLDDAQWVATTSGACAIYEDNSANNTAYGKLYNWYAVVDPRKIAPAGWHVPTETEWTTLTTFLGGSTIAGGKIKEAGLTHWNSPNTGATNSSGFTGLPGGDRYPIPSYGNIGIFGYWWSTTETFVDDKAELLGVSIYSEQANIYADKKIWGLSVRCIKD